MQYISAENKLKVSKNVPMSYGIRTIIDSAGLDSTFSDDSECSIVFQNKLKMIIYEPNSFMEIIQSQESKEKLIIENSRYDIIISFIDFIGFNEEYKGQLKNFTAAINKFKNSVGVKAIPIRNKLELTILVKNIIEKLKTAQNLQRNS